MYKKIQKSISYVLVIIMALTICMINPPDNVSAADVSESIWQNYSGETIYYDPDSDNLIYQTYDNLKSSSTFYRTIGIEFSRISPDVDPTDGVHGG